MIATAQDVLLGYEPSPFVFAMLALGVVLAILSLFLPEVPDVRVVVGLRDEPQEPVPGMVYEACSDADEPDVDRRALGA